MESNFELYHNDHGRIALSQHGGAKGQTISTRDYRQNVARDHARVHYGDQHHHYYAKLGDVPGMNYTPKDFMQLLLDSLSFPQKSSRFTTIEPAYRQTCQWLFETPEYTRWRNHDLRRMHNRTLWLKGKPGTGKSTITKRALEHANAVHPDERNIYFFFNARGDKLEKCNEGMFRSLLHQIAQDVPSLLQFVHAEAVAGYARTGWPLDLLRSLFREATLRLASKSQLNCYVDALDEGEDEAQVRDMVRFFEELAETAISKDIRLSIFFASRHYPHITVGRSEQIVVDNYEGHRADIASYVSSKLLCQPPTLKAELVASIIQRSSGIFLWVVLVVRILNTESDRGNQHTLKYSLQATPKALDELLGNIIRDDDADGLLLHTLLWVLFAKRSLSPLELYLAVIYCQKPDIPSSVVFDPTLVDRTSIKNFITSSSKGLLQVQTVTSASNAKYYQWYELGQDMIVEFIHESVREYLLGVGLLRLDPTLAKDIVGISHLRLARWCQSYVELGLLSGAVPQLTKMQHKAPYLLLEELLKIAPFSRYALAGILYHSEQAVSHELDVPVPFKDCLDTCLPLAVVCMSSSEPRFDSHKTTLHELVREGYTHLILKLLQSYNQAARRSYINLRVEGGNEHHRAALHLAARRSRFDVIQILLDNGADVNARDGDGMTILMYAAESGSPWMMQMVLEYGADGNAKDEWGDTALHHLAKTHNLRTFEALMRHSVDVNARNDSGYTPLMSAVIEANPAMVKALLAHAPDINAKNNDGRTSLHLATTSSLFADSGMLKILLQHGADTNIRDYSAEPLLNAVVRSRVHYVEDVQLLLSYGADVNAGDRFGTTALHAAVKRRDIQVVDAILQHNANVNGRDIWGATPLMLAFPKWQTVSTELVEMLLKNGADVNAGEWSNTTALRIAVEAENAGLTKLLLIYGADGDSQKEGYRSIMDIARGRPNKEIEWLLTYFADVPPRARFEAARAIGYQER